MQSTNTRHLLISGATLAILFLASPAGGRLVPAGEAPAQLMLVITPFVTLPIAWWDLRGVWANASVLWWQQYAALVGCLMLSVALAIPLVILFTSLDWLSWQVVCFIASLIALAAGLIGPAAVRLQLVVGGLVLASLVSVIPIGIL